MRVAGSRPATAGSGACLAGALALAVATAAASCTPSTQRTVNEAPAPEHVALTRVRFVEDDYAGALAEARARRVPLLVDAWASWCHTCLSMRSYVFPDPALGPFAQRFVWLSLDTEREQNEKAVLRLGVKDLPTLFVVDPATEATTFAWSGSLTASELTAMLDVVLRDGDASSEVSVLRQRGDLASAKGDIVGAIAAYRLCLDKAPLAWAERPLVVDALVSRLSDAERWAECATLGAEAAPSLPPGTPLADVLRTAIHCVQQVPADATQRALGGALASLGARVSADSTQPILADDRSDLYDYVVGELKALGQVDESRRLASAWASFLEERAAQAPSPSARAVFDAHRLVAYTALGQPERALPMLEKSAADFPTDYNPPARLGAALYATGKYDAAIAALMRAIDLAYGPRKLRLWSLEADVFLAKGSPNDARNALKDALAYAKRAPLTGSYPKLRDSLERRLAEMK
jgi:tetratricopeptide (TPR) repeat protein